MKAYYTQEDWDRVGRYTSVRLTDLAGVISARVHQDLLWSINSSSTDAYPTFAWLNLQCRNPPGFADILTVQIWCELGEDTRVKVIADVSWDIEEDSLFEAIPQYAELNKDAPFRVLNILLAVDRIMLDLVRHLDVLAEELNK